VLNKTAAQVAVQRVCCGGYWGLDRRQAVHALDSAAAMQRWDACKPAAALKSLAAGRVHPIPPGTRGGPGRQRRSSAPQRPHGIEHSALQVGAAFPVLSLPATYVIDTQGRIASAHLEADYRERADPAQVLAAVQALRR
jgi:hypothetical protein